MESTNKPCSLCGNPITQEQREWGAISANDNGEWSHDTCFDSSLVNPKENTK